MSESSLSIGLPELKQVVGKFIGSGSTATLIAAWSADKLAEVLAIIQSGVRQVYFPPGVTEKTLGYEWSWLRPTTTMNLGASGIDGSLVGDQFDSATFTDWAAQGITTDDEVTISGSDASDGTYEISSVAVGAITLTESPGDDTGLTFSILRSPADYDMPDDFGRLVGDLHYAADEHRADIMVVPLSVILEKRSRWNKSGYPEFAAVRYKACDGTTGSRQEILFYPKPDAYKVLSYEYEAYTGELTDAAPYPLGGMHLAELFIESCLAVAESRQTDEAGIHTGRFQAFLLDAIARDRKKGARNYGQMSGSEAELVGWRRGYTGDPSYPITYKGVAV